MSCFVRIQLSTSPIGNWIDLEKDSKWVVYIESTPISRKYVVVMSSELVRVCDLGIW